MSTENRHAFRVNAEVIFNFQIVDADTVNHASAEGLFPQSPVLALLSEFQRLDAETSALYPALVDGNRAMADYLAALNRKIELLSQHLLAQQLQQSDAGSASVNLSEGGLAFDCERILYKDTLLAVRLIFLPAYSGITTYMRVIRCQEEGQTYRVAAQFIELNPIQEQLLARHIMQTQISARRQAHSAGSNPQP